MRAFEESIYWVAAWFIIRVKSKQKHNCITTDGTVSNIISVIIYSKTVI